LYGRGPPPGGGAGPPARGARAPRAGAGRGGAPAARRAGVPSVVVPAADEGWGVPHEAPVSHEEFAAAVAEGRITGRIRVLGEAPGLDVAAATRLGTVTVLDGPVLASGRRELLALLREQAVSRTRHRYGHVHA
jgi:RHH-type transcriptional regulator, proline utilization regulon repressor / proline dehydrogenase / delta 1-pyrroline-5-carboxylate dehydrogenase